MDESATAIELSLPCDRGPVRLRQCRHGIMAFLKADDAIGRALELYGEFAESENRVMLSLVGPGDTVIDVGANVGTVTLAQANRVGPSGVIHAFEPQRIIHQLLAATLALNGLFNVRLYATALGAAAGTARIPAIDPYRPGNSGAIALGGETGDVIPVVTLDSYELPACRLLKIDVEGMDYQVLQGADQMVRRHRPHVYIEAKKGENTQAAIGWLLERGYRCYWHFAAFFSADNYRKSAVNVFGDRGDINLLALAPEFQREVNLPVVLSRDADWHQDYQEFLARRNKT